MKSAALIAMIFSISSCAGTQNHHIADMHLPKAACSSSYEGAYSSLDSSNSACVTIRGLVLDFSAGNVEVSAAPVHAENISYQCGKNLISFSFVDERGNRGNGSILFSDQPVLSLDADKINTSDIFASQILANYGQYKLKKGGCN